MPSPHLRKPGFDSGSEGRKKEKKRVRRYDTTSSKRRWEEENGAEKKLRLQSKLDPKAKTNEQGTFVF